MSNRLTSTDDFSVAFGCEEPSLATTKALLARSVGVVRSGSRGRRIAQFDFAIAEECQRYSECNRFTNVYGKHVVEVEYTDYPRAVFERACELRGANLSVLLRDRNVTARHSGEYRYEAC